MLSSPILAPAISLSVRALVSALMLVRAGSLARVRFELLAALRFERDVGQCDVSR